jgi:hypothetical protein
MVTHIQRQRSREDLMSLERMIGEVLLTSTGRLVVLLVSLGRWRGERFGGTESQTHAPAASLSFVVGSQRIITRACLFFIGIAFYVTLVFSLVAAGL